jgi:hypothetical protein
MLSGGSSFSGDWARPLTGKSGLPASQLKIRGFDRSGIFFFMQLFLYLFFIFTNTFFFECNQQRASLRSP